jgi:hypothetical protein
MIPEIPHILSYLTPDRRFINYFEVWVLILSYNLKILVKKTPSSEVLFRI